jgi:hypothetical protein
VELLPLFLDEECEYEQRRNFKTSLARKSDVVIGDRSGSSEVFAKVRWTFSELLENEELGLVDDI